MTLQRKLVATAVGSFLAGVLVTGVAADYVFKRYMQTVFASSFSARAVEAQFMAHELSMLRAGDTNKPVHDFEQVLDGDTMQLAPYEGIVPSAQRDPFVYRALADVRAYRAQYPPHFEYPRQQAEYQKALDLGKKAGE
jgi:hypothetical protein